MQIGEAIHFVLVLLGLVEEDPAFVAVVNEVTVFNCLPACRDNTAIPTPHWKRADDAGLVDDWKATAKKLKVSRGPYSKRAAVLIMNKPAKLRVKVKVLESVKVSGKAKLVGEIGDLEFTGECPTGTGEHEVDVKLTTPPKVMRSYRGRIRWTLATSSPAMTVSGGSSLIELYFVMAKPRQMFDAKGVWIELLRLMFGRVRMERESVAANVISKVTEYNFFDHRLKYDTFRGQAKYFQFSSWSFKLGEYLERVSERCNCYDQASAVQVFAGAVGVPADWLFLQPYGYIQLTNLIGFGACNNPFFGANTSVQIVDRFSPVRQAFGNHAFAGPTANSVADSCAGPHIGNETRDQYIAGSIDADSRLYATPADGPGTSGMIAPTPGVTSVR